MTKATNVTMLPVVFKFYRLYKGGTNKGKVITDSIYHMTLFRNPIIESVGATLKRAKATLGEDVHVVIQSAKESDEERKARYEKDGLELISDSKKPEIAMSGYLSKEDMAESGDTTFVRTSAA